MTAFTYLSRSFLKHCSSQSSAVKTSSGTDPVTLHVATLFFIFISLGILRSTWEFLEQNLGNSRKVEWQHWRPQTFACDGLVRYATAACGRRVDRKITWQKKTNYRDGW